MSNLAGVVRLLFRALCASAILFRAAADMVRFPRWSKGMMASLPSSTIAARLNLTCPNSVWHSRSPLGARLTHEP